MTDEEKKPDLRPFKTGSPEIDAILEQRRAAGRKPMNSGDAELDALYEQARQVHGVTGVAKALLRAMAAVPGSGDALLTIAMHLPRPEHVDVANHARRDQAIEAFKVELRRMVRPQ